MTRQIQIYDTTLRDGTQGEGVSLSLQDKLEIAKRLDEIGVDYIEGGYPLSNEKDQQFFQKVQQLGLQHAQVCAFGMTRRRGVAASEDPGMLALRDSQAPICTIVGKTWDFHVTDVLRVELAENLKMIGDSISFLVAEGREVIYDAEHYFDGTKANAQYAAKTIQAAAEAGASLIVLCDTNGGSMPEEITAQTSGAIELLSQWSVPVGIHCHNDCDVAVANSLAAVDAGAVQVQGTINGIGERCGNADLISVIANLAFKKDGFEVIGNTDFEHLTELSRFVYETANMRLQRGQPFVGRSAFAHKGGMHAHAIARAVNSYEHLDPAVVGNERRILISELSGRSNVKALTAEYDLSDDDQVMTDILAEVVKLENEGYQFEAAKASFALLMQRCAGTFNAHFEQVKYHVEVGAQEGKSVTNEATVKLRVAGEMQHMVAEGDGPVNALDAALRKALQDTYPTLESMRLVDYKVRVVNSEAGTAARTRVFIDCQDEHDIWGTVGVSENIIEASWIALVDAIEYKLYKDEQ